MSYKTVEGTDETGNPTTFKVEVPPYYSKLVCLESHLDGHEFEDYIYEYRGYILKEHYFFEEDCTHHSCVVHNKETNEKLAEFNWRDCLELAMAYVDNLVRIK